MYYFVYQTTNLINNKKYVGQHKTNKIDDGYLGSGKKLKLAIQKYKKENFLREILCFAKDQNELNELEKKWISELNAVESDEYYNIAEGGDGYTQRTFSEEERQRRSETAKRLYAEGKITSPCKGKFGKDHPQYGRKMSDEQKAHLSQLAKERYASGFDKSKIFTKARNEKISMTRKKNYAEGKYAIRDVSGKKNPMYGQKGELNPRFGVKLTEEERDSLSKRVKESYANGRVPNMLGKKWSDSVKKKISEKHKGQMTGSNNPNYGQGRQSGKAVYCIEKEKIYSSIAKAAKDNNCWPHQITKCLKSERETAGDVHWKYASQVNTVPSSD